MLRLLYLLLYTLIATVAGAQQITDAAKPYVKDRLAAAITTYQTMVEANAWNTFPVDLLLKPGDTSKHVTALQENLVLTGDLPLENAGLQGVYTSALEKAVRRFQARHGLAPDGVVGPNTVVTLNVPLTQRLWQLQHNLSLWDSSYLAAPQPYIVINLPDYTLQVVDSGKTVLQMRVIVGKPGLKTYPILSELDMLVLYPYWYIPKSIAVNEIVPLLRRNPGYLARKRMVLEKQSATGWVRVNPWRVNWQSIDASNYVYRIYQLAGKQNELGHVKFLYANKLPQYMHDTPEKKLFDYPNRAFSHGCIRLEKPFELADFILEKGSGYTPEKVKALWNQNKPNHYLKVKNPLPLRIVYFTAWVDEFEQVQFREDMYGFHQQPQLSAE
ncbi:L,D-transpeptidase family protein [uncultured Pontibacter sp.]|uniref:L,D-transpeptidase family protein n=1 Tax=uncultured Pontibacter sp. TaxID=453356 RepID=UPI002602C918|nr:L,D-transpeptidase family protein [uncultured Pontibacter sp.]